MKMKDISKWPDAKVRERAFDLLDELPSKEALDAVAECTGWDETYDALREDARELTEDGWGGDDEPDARAVSVRFYRDLEARASRCSGEKREENLLALFDALLSRLDTSRVAIAKPYKKTPGDLVVLDAEKRRVVRDFLKSNKNARVEGFD